MQILCAYKFELMPTGEQARNMRRFAGACRFVFNKALALQNENCRNGGKFIGYVPMAKHLTAWRNSVDAPWMVCCVAVPVAPSDHRVPVQPL
jgi:putative transposase